MSESRRTEGRFRRLAGRPSPFHKAEAFTDLFEYAHLPVYRYVYALHDGPIEEVEDLTAETFIRAWNARARFNGSREAAVGWLLQIARRLMIDAYRRWRVRGISETLETTDPPASEGTPEEQVMQDEERQTLRTMLQSLPVEHAEILVLRYLLGWRVKAIARHLAMSDNNVSVTLRRILQRLRRDWPQLDVEE